MEGRKISPAPNWTSIFTQHPELDPPGYAEVFVDIHDNPRIKPKQIEQEKTAAKKRKKKLGRNEKV